jgi:hypothetical protein
MDPADRPGGEPFAVEVAVERVEVRRVEGAQRDRPDVAPGDVRGEGVRAALLEQQSTTNGDT